MKILSLSVSGAGRFDRRVSVTGFGDGVNVLCESNEAGKSTLFKALRTCLFERHSSNTQDLRDLASEGLSLPIIVRLGFEHGGKSYEIEKSFLKQRRASFRADGREVATNQEADEALWEVLGVAPGSGRAVDQAQFGLLWVSQGQSFERPALSGAATGALAAAVQAEVGALVGGERARLLLGELKRDIGEFVTESSAKPKAGGPLAQALNESAVLTGAIAEAERKLATMESQIERLAQLRRERADVADPDAIRRDEADLAAAEADLAAARAARDRLTLKEPMLKASQAALEEARRRDRERIDRANRIDADRTTIAAAQLDLEKLAEQEGAASERLLDARSATEAEGAAETEDESALARLAGLAGLIAEAGLRPDQMARRAALAEASRRLGEIDASLAGSTATDERLDRLDNLERAIAGQRAAVEVGSVRIEIAVAPAGEGRILIDGKPAGSTRLNASGPLVIDAGGLATLSIVPPAGGEAERVKLQAMEAKRAALLGESGFADGAALRVAVQKRRSLEQERSGALGALKGLGVGPAGAAAELQKLDAMLEAHDRRLAATLEAAGLAALPDRGSIETERAAIEARRSEARAARARLEGRKEAENEALRRLAAERARRQADLDAAESRLAIELTLLPDAARASVAADAQAAIAAAETAFAAEAAAVETLRRETPDAERMRQLEIRVERLRSARKARELRLAEIDREIAHREGQVETAGGEGLGEELARLSDEAALWERVAKNHDRRVRTLQLLRDEIAACYDEQRDRLHAPIKRHLKPYLEDVFSRADPEFGEGYAVDRISRGAAQERFELLSDGTKEQIAVLTRLAMGSLLAERGQAVPIILDDALVYSDDERIERMFDALGRAAGQQQVVVFTCRTRAFQRLGGRRLTLEVDRDN
jgi:DNA repair exonuclease SbcCD ATPase subunit